MYIWLMNGTTVLGTEGYTRTVADANWQVAGIADFDGDGKDDVLWHNSSTGANVVWYLSGTTLLSQASLPSVPDLTWQRVATADLNGDGHPDLIWRNNVTGANVVWLMNGATLLNQVVLPIVPDLAWQLVEIGRAHV